MCPFQKSGTFVGVAFSQVTNRRREWTSTLLDHSRVLVTTNTTASATTTINITLEPLLQDNMVLLILTEMLLITYICEGALIKKSSASDFLQTKRERRDAECYFGDCSRESSEVDEMLNTGPDYEEASDVQYEGHESQNMIEETSDVSDNGDADPNTDENDGQISVNVEIFTDIYTHDPVAGEKVNGHDGQKVHHVELGAVDGSGM